MAEERSQASLRSRDEDWDRGRSGSCGTTALLGVGWWGVFTLQPALLKQNRTLRRAEVPPTSRRSSPPLVPFFLH